MCVQMRFRKVTAGFLYSIRPQIHVSRGQVEVEG